VIDQKVLTYDQIPCLMQVVEYVSKNGQFDSFFAEILNDFKKKPSLKMQKMWEEQLDVWVTMAYEESSSRKQDINKFFNDLS